MSINLSETTLRCPGCGSTDTARMYIFRMEWLNAATGLPVYAQEQDVLPTPPEGEDSVECWAVVDDTVDPICHHRSSVDNFALYGSGVQVMPLDDSAVHGMAAKDVPGVPVVAEETPAGGDVGGAKKKKKPG